VRPLLVGEANPYGSAPEFALYPSPRGCSCDRLCRLVLGLDPDDYLERFDRVNLCPREWSIRDARIRAETIRKELRDAPVVLLGAKVCAAFEVTFRPFSAVGGRVRAGSWVPVYVVMPHPSGLSRAWGAPGAYERARAVLREAGVLPGAAAPDIGWGP
jgi:hypothetical protein